MKVLLIGSGGREHALAWKLTQSPLLQRLFIVPGNPGTACYGENRVLPLQDLHAVVDLAKHEAVDLIVVGPEAPLSDGLVDLCHQAGLFVFGPTAAAARIESSKSFAKEVMRSASVPTAEAYSFTEPTAAADFARRSRKPWVVKADGLALGKGVIVADDLAATLQAIDHIGTLPSGQHLLLEERLFGPEISVHALCDGRTLLPLPPARDHKRLFNGDIGPNTGGVGAIAPVDNVSPAMSADIVRHYIQPVADVLAAQGTPFCGVLYAGLILTDQGPKVLEFNARFGDPETQVIMPLLKGDLLAAMHACATGRLQPDMLEFNPGYATCVVLTAAGYPDQPRKGDPISGLDSDDSANLFIFQAGTVRAQDRLVTAGGRVLGVTAVDADRSTSRERAYAAIKRITFADMHYRTDIGL